MNMIGKFALPLLLLGAGISVAHAADAVLPVIVPETKPVENSEWRFAASPYFWAAGISGDVGQFGLPAVHLKSDFGDILNDLDFSFMGVAEARNDRYSFFGDIIYTKTTTDSGTPRDFFARDVSLTSQTFTGLFGAGYSLFTDGKSNFDAVAGARIWYAKTELSFSGGLLDGVERSDSATWVDGMAGFRGRYFLSDNVYLSGWGLIGAGQAKLDWDVAAGIGYQFNENISAVAGYRALGVDYDHDDFVFDVVQQGPILGLAFRF